MRRLTGDVLGEAGRLPIGRARERERAKRIRIKVSLRQIFGEALVPSLQTRSGLPFIENRHSASFHPSASS